MFSPIYSLWWWGYSPLLSFDRAAVPVRPCCHPGSGEGEKRPLLACRSAPFPPSPRLFLLFGSRVALPNPIPSLLWSASLFSFAAAVINHAHALYTHIHKPAKGGGATRRPLNAAAESGEGGQRKTNGGKDSHGSMSPPPSLPALHGPSRRPWLSSMSRFMYTYTLHIGGPFSFHMAASLKRHRRRPFRSALYESYILSTQHSKRKGVNCRPQEKKNRKNEK